MHYGQISNVASPNECLLINSDYSSYDVYITMTSLAVHSANVKIIVLQLEAVFYTAVGIIMPLQNKLTLTCALCIFDESPNNSADNILIVVWKRHENSFYIIAFLETVLLKPFRT